MHGFLPWFTIILDLLLLAVFFIILMINYRWRMKIRKQRDALLQEKEAALGFVHNVGEVFSDAESIEMNHLLDRVLHYAVRTCKASSGAIYLVNTSNSMLEARAVSGIFPPPYNFDPDTIDLRHDAAAKLDHLVRSTALPFGEGLIGEAAVLGNSILVEDAERDARVTQIPDDFLAIRTLMVIPMRFGNRTIGVMALVNRTGGGHFSLPDLYLAQALAAQASVPIHYAGLQEALDQKRQLDHDMQIAQQIQSSLLPQGLPTYEGLQLAAFNYPAMDIGGDYYDCITIDEHHIGLAIADVSGKGIGGALMMAVCRSVLRVNAEDVIDPSTMLCSLNRILSTNLADDMFITMLYMVINIDTHLLSYARAGHEAPIIIRNGEAKTTHEESGGIAIGLVDDDVFESAIETKKVSLHTGDLVVTYTDGITEAMNSGGQEWGISPLRTAIEKMADASASDLLHNIRKEVIAFTGTNQQSDDMTMLALKIV